MGAARRLDGQQARGRITAYLGPLIIAEVTISFQVDAGAGKRAPPTDTVTAHRYRRIFASYSHLDQEVVRWFGTLVRAMGDEFVRDVTHLRAGQVWSPQLEALIRSADVFQLFWSSHSMVSPFVRQEWEFALALGRPEFVRPVYWEPELPRSKKLGLPPPELEALHFERLDGIGSPGGVPAFSTRFLELLSAWTGRYDRRFSCVVALAVLAALLLVFLWLWRAGS
jgi:hypothetical protein